MKNQRYTGTPTSARFFPCPITVKSGDPVLIGTMAAVALNDYQSNTGGATFYLNGTYDVEVLGSSSHSPSTGEELKPGGPVFASGHYDSGTNVTTGLLISGDVSDVPFGNIDASGPGVSSGASAIVGVKIGGGA